MQNDSKAEDLLNQAQRVQSEGLPFRFGPAPKLTPEEAEVLFKTRRWALLGIAYDQMMERVARESSG